MKKRNILLMLLYSIITLGIYVIYWYCSFQKNLKKQTGEGLGTFLHLLLSICTLGIYYLIWSFTAGRRLHKLGAQDFSIAYLLLSIFGLGFIGMFIMQYQANNLK